MNQSSGILVADLSGRGVRGRVLGAFSPASVPGLQLWLDGPSLPGADGSSVTTWPDRSPNGNNGTGTLASVSVVGGKKFVFLDQSSSLASIKGNVIAGTTTLTVVTVARLLSGSLGQGRLCSLGVTGQDDTSSAAYTAAIFLIDGVEVELTNRNNANLSGGTTNPNQVYILSVVFDGVNNTMYLNGVAQSSAASVGTFGIQNYALGAEISGGGSRWSGDIGSMLIYSPGISSTNRTKVESYLAAEFGLLELLCIGCSITSGFGLTAANSYPSQVQTAQNFWYVINGGINGQTTQDIIGNFSSQVTSKVSAIMPTKISAEAALTNQLFFGSTPADTYSKLQTLCGMIRALGKKVVVITVLPRNDSGTPGTFEADRQMLNTSIRNNYASFADGLWDAGADPTIGAPGAYSNTTYYQADECHLTAAGYAIYAAGVQAAVQSI